MITDTLQVLVGFAIVFGAAAIVTVALALASKPLRKAILADWHNN